MTHRAPTSLEDTSFYGLRDGEEIDGFVIAVDRNSEGFMVSVPLEIHPSFFQDGPQLKWIPVTGMHRVPGVYAVTLKAKVLKAFHLGARTKWADEIEWQVVKTATYTHQTTTWFR